MPETLQILKEVVDNSSQLSSWALAVGAGTVAVIVSTSYHRPASLILRLPYLLFILGWVSLGYSLLLGNEISRRYLASLMVEEKNISIISSEINDIFARQQDYLFVALLILFVWLLLFIFMWVFSRKINGGGNI